MSDEETGGVFIDGENGTNFQQELTFRGIVLNHIIKINNITCKEFAGGYWKTVVRAIGTATYSEKVWVSDVRQEYINAVNNLSDLLLPHFDVEMSAFDSEHLKTVNGLTDPDELVKHTRWLFRALNQFLKRKNYLEVADFEV